VKRTDPKTNKTGVATIASMVRSDNQVQIGVSFCSPRDRFDKRLGRAFALEKMAKIETSVVSNFTGHSSDTIANVWDVIEKPSFWKNTKIVNVPEVGLTVIDFKTF